MKEKLKNIGEKKIIIVCSILLVICLLVGLSYAWLSQTVLGQKNLTVTVGDLDFILDESTSEGIVLKYAIPIEDVDGQALEPYTFTIQNNSGVASSFRLTLEKDEEGLASCQTEAMVSCEPLDVNDIRYEIKEDGVSKIGTLGESGLLLDSYLEKGEKNSYELRLWLDIDTGNEAEGKVYYGKLKLEAVQTEERKTVSETLLAGVGQNGNIDTSDPDQTFITGSDPNNYIWYSGKLWRAVSIDPSDNSVKLVTQWNISAIAYNSSNNSSFEGSYMESWLNDTSVDGFLGNLREPEKFIKMDSKWNTTKMTDTSKPPSKEEGATVVEDAVGLLNIYEYNKAGAANSYLNNGLKWWAITAPNSSINYRIYNDGAIGTDEVSIGNGIRPSINLNPNVMVVSGNGTVNDPYRLMGDNDTDIAGTLLSTRYSGEYIRFGVSEENLYRIVSHESKNNTKIALEDTIQNVSSIFGDNPNYSIHTTIGSFLNGEYLDNEKYLRKEEIDMIEQNTVWYLNFSLDYRLTKYVDSNMTSFISNTTIVPVGLLRYGELMAGQFDRYENNANYFLLSPEGQLREKAVYARGEINSVDIRYPASIKPSFNLKSNVIITGGTGTKQDPFEIALE